MSPEERQMICAEIRETHRMRQDLLRAATRLNLQQQAVHRRMAGESRSTHGARRSRLNSDHPASGAQASAHGDGAATHISRLEIRSTDSLAALATIPLATAEASIREAMRPLEKRLVTLGKLLPVWTAFVADVRGMAPLGLAQVIGETGDLSNYPSPRHVWKRMGLAVMDDGTRQRKVIGDAALLHGYDPERRSVAYLVGTGLLIHNREGAYRTFYDVEKVRQAELHPDLKAGHVHLRAHRHMTKRFLLDLWIAWNPEMARPTCVADHAHVVHTVSGVSAAQQVGASMWTPDLNDPLHSTDEVLAGVHMGANGGSL